MIDAVEILESVQIGPKGDVVKTCRAVIHRYNIMLVLLVSSVLPTILCIYVVKLRANKFPKAQVYNWKILEKSQDGIYNI